MLPAAQSWLGLPLVDSLVPTLLNFAVYYFLGIMGVGRGESLWGILSSILCLIKN